jgi:hypothetical protein
MLQASLGYVMGPCVKTKKKGWGGGWEEGKGTEGNLFNDGAGDIAQW